MIRSLFRTVSTYPIASTKLKPRNTEADVPCHHIRDHFCIETATAELKITFLHSKRNPHRPSAGGDTRKEE